MADHTPDPASEGAPPADKSEATPESLQDAIRHLLPESSHAITTEELAAITRALSGPAAPVRLPSDDDMAVRLVSEAHLLRYIELSDDRTLLTGLAFLFLGGGIAFLINLATATDQVPADAWAAFGLVTFAGLVFSFLAYRAGRRTRASRKHLWGSESDHAS